MTDKRRTEQIRDEVFILYKEAEASGFSFLAYLLGMAVQEATELSSRADVKAEGTTRAA